MPCQIEEYFEWLTVAHNRPATTVRTYRQHVRSPDVLEGLDRAVLRRYQVELADVLPHPRARAAALVALRGFLSFAYDEGWTPTLLSRQVTIPRFVTGDPHPVRTEDVPKLLAALPRRNLRDLRDRALVSFLFASGCRIAEACALNREDLRLGPAWSGTRWAYFPHLSKWMALPGRS